MTPKQRAAFERSFMAFPIVLIIIALCLVGGAISLAVSTSYGAVLGAKLTLGLGALMLAWNTLGAWLSRNE